MQRALSIADAAQRLGVTQPRVRALIASGKLEAEKVGGRWLVDAQIVERLRRNRERRGRPLSLATLWGLVMAASGAPTAWLSPWQRTRNKKRLADSDWKAFIPTLSRGSRVHRLAAHPSDLSRILDEPSVVRSGVSAARDHGIDIVATDQIDAYVPKRKFAKLCDRYALEQADQANVVLRAVEDPWPFPADARVAPPLVVAINLLESDDARTRRAGADLFKRALAGTRRR